MQQFYLERFIKVAIATQAAIMDIAGHLVGMEGRNGAYFGVGGLDGLPISMNAVGTATQEKWLKYHRVANKKLTDLALAHRINGAVFRSRDFLDDDLERFPGAVVGGKCIFTISGYLGWIDEGGSAAMAYAMSNISFETAQMLLEGNPHKERCVEICATAYAAVNG